MRLATLPVGYADGLTMEPAERRRRAKAIQAQVRENDVAKWVAGLLADLDGLSA